MIRKKKEEGRNKRKKKGGNWKKRVGWEFHEREYFLQPGRGEGNKHREYADRDINAHSPDTWPGYVAKAGER